MTRITIDESIRSKFHSLSEPLELCDETGRIVGHYLPEEDYRRILYGSLSIPFSDEEVARRRSETGGRSLADIWKDLGRK